MIRFPWLFPSSPHGGEPWPSEPNDHAAPSLILARSAKAWISPRSVFAVRAAFLVARSEFRLNPNARLRRQKGDKPLMTAFQYASSSVALGARATVSS